MRRDGGNFEVVIKAPTLGLVTRIPSDQPDARAFTRATNVRFDDGVARNGPGYAALSTTPPLPEPAVLVHQANLFFFDTTASYVVLGTGSKLYLAVRT